MGDNSCKTSRWRLLKARLNNLPPKVFSAQLNTFNKIVLIDVRTPEEFEHSHISGAVNVSYLADNFWDEMEQYDPDQYFFVYCRTGRRSIRACTLMGNGGFKKDRIFNLEGGYTSWVEAGLEGNNNYGL